MRYRRRFTIGSEFEHEELRFHSGVHRGEAQRLRVVELPAQNTTRVTVEWLAVRSGDVADQSADAVLRIAPRKYLKRREVRGQKHVRFLDSNKSFDRRAVEHDVPFERVLKLRFRNLDVLVDPKNVRELESHEPHVVFCSEIENFFLARTRSIGNGRT